MARAKTPLTHAQFLGLFAMALAVLVIANDFTSLSVALPSMEHEFHADVTTVQWVINGYALVFGVLIVSGGRLADLFGRRRIFLVGSVIFAGFSLLGGLAPSVGTLLAARGAMGIGGAMMWPAVLGMTYAICPKERAGLAGALIIGCAGFGNSVGPLIGGALTDSIGWRWVFFLNLPVALIAGIVTRRVVPRETIQGPTERLDYAGVATLSVGLLSLLLALDMGIDMGWTNPRILALFGMCAAGLTTFGFVENRVGPRALVPREMMKNRVFLAASLATLLCSAIFFAALLYLPQFMSKVLGYSAMGAGAGLLPMMGVFALASFTSESLYARLGPKVLVSVGAAALGGGMLLLSGLHENSGYRDLVPGMVVVGLGIGWFYSSITTTAITAVPDSRSSLAGAIVYMCQVAGGSIGLGMNTAIVVSAGSLPEGMHRAFLMNTVLAAGSVLVAVAFLGGSVHRETIRGLVHRHRAHG